MPDHESWLSILLGTFWANIEVALRQITGHGHTFVGHQPIGAHPAVGFLFVIVILTLFALKVRSSVLDVDNPEVIKPDGTLTLRNFAELVTGAVLGMMKGMMTEKQARYFLPLIGTCAFVIFFSNVMGLIPGMLPPTDSLNTTVPCAIVIFVATHVYGVKEHGLPYFKHFFGPMIGIKWIPLMALMFLIEVVSHLVRPVTLAVRLMANMFADHMVLTIFIGLAPFVVPVPMYMMGCIVVTVQTLVFCMLSAIYIGLAVAHDGH